MSTLNKIKVEDTLYDLEDAKARKGLINKVDKVEGKDLSSNDFTNEYKEKLDGLSNIKTINGESILGIGDIKIQGGTSGNTTNFEVLIDFTTEETVAEFQVPIGTDEIVEKIKKATDIYLLISIPRDAEGDTTTDSVGNITLSLYTTWNQMLFSDVSIITSPSHTWSWGGKMLCHFTNVPLCDSRGIAQAPTLQECFYCRDSVPNSSKSVHTGQGINIWNSYFNANSYFIVTGTQNMYKGTRFILGVGK